jgi:hypothetical protein
LFDGSTVGDSGVRSIGWHGTSVEAHEGAFAVVSADFQALVGEVVQVRARGRSVAVYVIGVRRVPVDLSLSRRAFLSLAGLATLELRGRAGVVL